MARDDHPKARYLRDMARKKSFRAGRDRILIVSEGSKTEPLYFNEIRQSKKISTTEIAAVPSEFGTDPIQVVQYARTLFLEGDPRKRIQSRAFEQIFVVFDRDEHKTYFDALKYAEELDKKLQNQNKQSVRFRAIPSVPCFELWLLLHYDFVDRPLHRHEALKRLKEKIVGYEKGCNQIYATTKDLVVEASNNARRLAKTNSPFDGKEPYTNVHELVELLETLSR